MAVHLTRTEARRRSSDVAVQRYAVAFDLRSPGPTFTSTTDVWFTGRPGGTTHLDLCAEHVEEVAVNGCRLDPRSMADGHRVHVGPLAADNHVRVRAACAYSSDGRGLHRVAPPGGGTYVTSQFQPFDAHRAYACFDQADLKAAFEFTVTGPAQWTIISNAPALSRHLHRDGSATTRFARTEPIPTYGTAVVGGTYHRVSGEFRGADGAGTPLGLFCRGEIAQHLDADELLGLTRQGLAYFTDLFGCPYPFPKYDLVFAPQFRVGAMENPGAVVVDEELLFHSQATPARHEHRAMVLLHELAHMWFGNLVTLAWWDDLWLNESFATYAALRCQAEATRWRGSWATFAIRHKAWAAREDQSPGSRPIVADLPDTSALAGAFDGITYAKGTAVLRQLAAWVGTERFDAALPAYVREHAWQTASLDDLLGQLRRAGAGDPRAWADRWLHTTGLDTLRPAGEVNGGRISSFVIHREAPAGASPRPHRLQVGLYDRLDGRLVRRRQVAVLVDNDRTPVPALTGLPAADVVLINDDDLTYAKVRFDAATMAVLTTDVGAFGDPLARALSWTTAWDMTRDGELAATDFITMVLAGAGTEPDVAIAEVLLDQADIACSWYVQPSRVVAQRTRLADAALTAARAAEVGSGRQLTWAQAFIANARTDNHLALLRDLLARQVAVPGLAVDTDLRWRILRRLSAAGQVDPAELDGEAARTPTPNGARHAAACRAALPTVEAKAAAWQFLRRFDQPPPTVVAVGRAWAQPEHGALLRPFLEDYLDRVGEFWRGDPGPAAKAMVRATFPACVDEEAASVVRRSLLGRGWPGPLRLLVEGCAEDLERAVRCRTRDDAPSERG